MAGNEAKLKHLDYIQAAIARMANHSFLFKGWSMTIVGALFAFVVVEAKWALVVIALVTTLLFWGARRLLPVDRARFRKASQ
jgi:uncharacterized membrane protein